MASGKKNEILLSIALDGDSEVKKKLADVAESGKRSLDGIGKGGGGLGGEGGLFGKGGGLGSLFDASGLGRALDLARGFVGRLGGTILGGGLPAAAIAIGQHLGHISEQAERAQQKLKELGGNDNSFNKARASAQKLDANVNDLLPANEEFQTYRRRQQLQSPYGVANVSEDQFLAAQRALIAGGKIGGLTTPDSALRSAGLLSSLYQPHDIGDGTLAQGLTPSALKALAPAQGNRLARALGGELGIPFRNTDELQLFLEQRDKQGRSPVIKPETVFRALQRDEPASLAEAEKHRTIEDSTDRLGNRAGDFRRSLADIVGPTSSKSAIGFNDAASDTIKTLTARVDANKATAQSFGKSGLDLGNKLGIPGAGQLGETVGTFEGLIFGLLRDAFKGYGQIGGRFTDRAFGGPETGQFTPLSFDRRQRRPDRGLIDTPLLPDQPQAAPAPAAPPAVPAPQPAAPPGFVREPGGFLIKQPTPNADGVAPAPPPAPAPVTPPPADVGRVGSAAPTIDTTALDQATKEAGGALQSLVTAISDAATQIRNSTPAGSASSGASSSSSSGAAASSAEPSKFAGGGAAINVAGGGQMVGTGGPTSDNIPAWVSPGEYIINAQAASKIGLAHLDWLNAGKFAGGGSIDGSFYSSDGSIYSSDGSFSSSDGSFGQSGAIASQGDDSTGGGDQPWQLKRGQYSIEPSPYGGAIINGSYYPAGHPMLQNPAIRDALNRARQPSAAPRRKVRGTKSSFVGSGDPNDMANYQSQVDGYASGGAVGHVSTGGRVPGFAKGGFVDAAPHFAMGGLADMAGLVGGGAPPQLNSESGGASPWADMPHLGSMDWRTNAGDVRVVAPAATLRNLRRAARDELNVKAGASASWED